MKEADEHPQVEALLQQARPRAVSPLPARDRIAESGIACLLAAATIALAVLFESPRELHVATALALLASFIVARNVRFTLGAGTASPTQPVLVCMLLLLPAAAVPPLVVAGAIAARAADYAKRKVHPDHALLNVGDAWHAFGPALVIAVFAPGPPSIADWPIYVAALAAQFVFDAGSSLIREWLANGVPPKLQLRLLALAFSVDAALAPIGLLAALVAVDHPAAIVLVLPLVGLLAALGQERERRIEHTLALSAAYRGSALLVGEMLEADDAYTGGEHTHGVVQLCLAVGEELKLTPSERRDLEFGALLHDVGKLRTPNEIINKPGALTPDEWDIIRRHPIDGQDMLDRIGGVLTHAGLIVRSHHERWDGGGYPDGLVAEEIPLASRIVSACDAFSAMTTDRSYRRALPVREAAAELRRCAGAQFDPRVVTALLTVVERSGALDDDPSLRRAA